MPSHFSSRAKNILSQSSPVATQIPHAVGAALALKWMVRRKLQQQLLVKVAQTKVTSMKV